MPESQPEYLNISQAAARCPSRRGQGETISSSTITSWHRRGIKRPGGDIVKLQCVRFGKYLFTTQAWLDAFNQALSETAPPSPVTLDMIRLPPDAVKHRLDDAGI